MTKTRRALYTLEFKQEAAWLVDGSQSIAAAARTLGVVEQTLYLKGEQGDRLHAVLCAAGYNTRWLLRMIARKGLPFLLRLYLRLGHAATMSSNCFGVLRALASITLNGQPPRLVVA